jgi:6-phosphogluconate dehydrogenase
MRNMSAEKEDRERLGQSLQGPPHAFHGDRDLFLGQLRDALYAGMVLTYAQGMALLQRASTAYNYNLPLAEVARIWRGGCIIRAALLDDIRAAYQDRSDPAHPLLNPHLGQAVTERQEDLRNVIHAAVEMGLPVPGLMASLAYFDATRSAWLPANLIQAQRDYFGAHTYERIDDRGVFHTHWNAE